MRNLLFKNKIRKCILSVPVIAAGILVMSTNVCASSVEIMVGGADIFAPKSVFARFDGYLGTVDEDTEVIMNEPLGDVSGIIRDGIFIDDVDVSGLTYNQAIEAVNAYVDGLSQKTITIQATEENSDEYTAGDFGLFWANEDAVKDAIMHGKSGNLIFQYKSICDLKQNNLVLPLDLKFDHDVIADIVEAEADKYNISPVNAKVERIDGKYRIMDAGRDGVEVNVAKTVSDILTQLNDWNKENVKVSLATEVSKVDVDESAFDNMTDILGTYTTSFKTSSKDRSGNVRTGCSHIDGTLLYPGDQMSAYEKISPFTVENGYFMAGSYLNGMVVDTLGGGICQVSSTLYNAVIRAELQVDERYPHSMAVNYVGLSSDAAIAGTSKDFKFTNNTEYPIYIEGYTTDEKTITFNIYGHETRPANRTVEFESVEIAKEEPVTEKIIPDPSQPVGFISTQSAHIGYSGELWKIVKVDGVETERTRFNKSHYTPSERTAVVGVGTADSGVLAAISSAIASGSIDYVKETIAGLNAAAAQAAAEEGQ